MPPVSVKVDPRTVAAAASSSPCCRRRRPGQRPGQQPVSRPPSGSQQPSVPRQPPGNRRLRRANGQATASVGEPKETHDAPCPACQTNQNESLGDTCSSENDCDLDYVCSNRKCAAAPGSGPTSTARNTPVATGGAKTTTVFVTAPRSSTTARQSQGQVVVTTVIVRPTTTPSQGGGSASCGDNPIACVGESPLATNVLTRRVGH